MRCGPFRRFQTEGAYQPAANRKATAVTGLSRKPSGARNVRLYRGRTTGPGSGIVSGRWTLGSGARTGCGCFWGRGSGAGSRLARFSGPGAHAGAGVGWRGGRGLARARRRRGHGGRGLARARTRARAWRRPGGVRAFRGLRPAESPPKLHSQAMSGSFGALHAPIALNPPARRRAPDVMERWLTMTPSMIHWRQARSVNGGLATGLPAPCSVSASRCRTVPRGVAAAARHRDSLGPLGARHPTGPLTALNRAPGARPHVRQGGSLISP